MLVEKEAKYLKGGKESQGTFLNSTEMNWNFLANKMPDAWRNGMAQRSQRTGESLRLIRVRLGRTRSEKKLANCKHFLAGVEYDDIPMPFQIYTIGMLWKRDAAFRSNH